MELLPSTPFVLTLPANATVNSAGEVVADLSLDGMDAADLTLSNLSSAATARTNLGGTADGAALFTAASVADQRTALGVSPTTDVDLKSDIHLMGPIVVDLDSNGNLSAVRWRPGFAGTIANLTMTISAAGPITTGAGEVTVEIAGVACTTAAPLSAPVASAVGFAVDTAVTAGGAFTANQEIAVIPGGTNSVIALVGVGIEYTRA